MNFEQAHTVFLQHHLKLRKGERRGRLERGHLYAETMFLKRVWWPIQGNLDHLHPEYEVRDWRGRSYFGDFAFLPACLKLIIEIKGYNPHVKDMDRQGYCNELNRELYLQASGFRVISFAYDDVMERPDTCIFLLRMLLGRFKPSEKSIDLSLLAKREIILLSQTKSPGIRPIDVEKHLSMNHRQAVNLLQSLVSDGILETIKTGNGQRVRYYQLSDIPLEL